MRYSSNQKVGLTTVFVLGHISWIALFAPAIVNFGFVAFAVITITGLRGEFCEHFKLNGNMISDFLAGLFLYPQALCQMLFQFEVAGEIDKSVTHREDTSREETLREEGIEPKNKYQSCDW
jgi:voltage-gated potassium channel Kch